MDIQYLREYIALSINKSYSAAARECMMSHTTLYRHMLALESELGTRLILSTNPITLTTEGKKVLAHAGNIVAEYDEMSRDLRGLSGQLSGDVRLLEMTPQNDSMPLISGVLFELRRRYPNLNPVLCGPASGFDVMSAVCDGALDIGFRYCWYRDGEVPELPHDMLAQHGLVACRLPRLRFELRFGIGPEHPLYGRRPGTFADFARIGFMMPANKVYRDSVDPFIDFCLNHLGVTPKIRYAETESLMNMWLNNLGRYAFILTEHMLPEQMLPAEFMERIELANPMDGPYWMELYAVARERSNDATLAALSALVEQLGAQEPDAREPGA